MQDSDAILIPGGGVREGGALPSWVERRLDRSVQFMLFRTFCCVDDSERLERLHKCVRTSSSRTYPVCTSFPEIHPKVERGSKDAISLPLSATWPIGGRARPELRKGSGGRCDCRWS